MPLILNVDGGSRGNPGPAGAGVVIRSDSDALIHEAGYFLGRQTNNAAEYMALLRGLERAEKLGGGDIRVLSDSELLVRQLTGEYRVKSPSLAALFEQVQLRLLRVARWQAKHIPREQNRRADELANMAMDRGADVIVFDIDSPEASKPPGAQQPAEPATTAPTSAQAARSASEPRAVQVVVARQPAAGECPCQTLETPLVFRAALPSGVCIHAAHALIPTVVALQSIEAAELHGMPTMMLRCSRRECSAVFHITQATSGNGVPGV